MESHGDLEKGGTELSVVKGNHEFKKAINGTTPVPGPSTPCKPEICQATRSRFHPPDLAGNPWHAKKTIFLLLTIALLVIWIIIYSTLSKLDIL